MVVEVEPGSGKKHIEDGANFTLAQTEPNTNLDAFLGTLDADTRQYLQLLLAGGGQGIGGRGNQLGNALRRFQPFVHYAAKLNKVVAQRHVAAGQGDPQLRPADRPNSAATTPRSRRFVTSSDAALGNFANQQRSIQEVAAGVPGDPARRQRRPRQLQPLLDAAFPALTKLIPQAQASTPGLQGDSRTCSARPTAPIRDPDPALHPPDPAGAEPRQRRLRAAQQDGAGTSATRSAGFNSFFNELAYKPKGKKQSFLFYLPWLNHDFNAAFNLQDAGGPVLRGMILISCTGCYLGYGADRQTQALPQNAAAADQRSARRRNPGLVATTTGKCEVQSANEQDAPPAPRSSWSSPASRCRASGSCSSSGSPSAARPRSGRKPYEIKVPFNEATQLAEQSDVRISGVNVGKVQNIALAPNGKQALATVDIDDKYAPLPESTRAILRTKTLLGETYIELTPGNRRRARSWPTAATVPEANVAESVQLDEIFRTFDPKTRAAFQTWMQEAAVAINGQGQSLSYGLGELEPTFTELDQPLPRARHPATSGRRSCSATAPPPSRPCAAAKASWRA